MFVRQIEVSQLDTLGQVIGALQAAGYPPPGGQVSEAFSLLHQLELSHRYPLTLPSLSSIEARLGSPDYGKFRRGLEELQEAHEGLVRLGAAGRFAPPAFFRRRTGLPTADQWRAAIGKAVFQAIRFRHVRHSPAATSQAGTLSLDLFFDPATGQISRIRESYPGYDPGLASHEVLVRVLYSHDTRKTFLAERAPRFLHKAPGGRYLDVAYDADAPAPSDPIVIRGEERTLPESVLALLEGVDDQPVTFPKIRLRKRKAGGIEVVALSAGINDDNAYYAQKVMHAIHRTLGGVTIAFHAGHPRIPPLDIHVSVAENGYFVGFTYAMPTEASPRGTYREAGTPALGMLARVSYDRYHSLGDPKRSHYVPLDVSWGENRPSRIQETALETWCQRVRERLEHEKDQWVALSDPSQLK